MGDPGIRGVTIVTTPPVADTATPSCPIKLTIRINKELENEITQPFIKEICKNFNFPNIKNVEIYIDEIKGKKRPAAEVGVRINGGKIITAAELGSSVSDAARIALFNKLLKSIKPEDISPIQNSKPAPVINVVASEELKPFITELSKAKIADMFPDASKIDIFIEEQKPSDVLLEGTNASKAAAFDIFRTSLNEKAKSVQISLQADGGKLYKESVVDYSIGGAIRGAIFKIKNTINSTKEQ